MKKRILSAVVALAILIPLVLLGGYPLAFTIGILSVLAYKEVLDLEKAHGDIPNVVKVLGLISLVYLVLGSYMNETLSYIKSAKILLPLLLVLSPTVFYQKKYSTNDAFNLLAWIYLIGIVFNFLLIIRGMNLNLLIYLISISFITDTFAFSIGSLIGKNKMCPKISPHKSWEGAIAGLLGGSIVSLIIYGNLINTITLNVVIMTIILSIVGQIGDLVFSKIKRDNKIKDFSNLIPGHGGILDRLDSLSFVTITYVLLRAIL